MTTVMERAPAPALGHEVGARRRWLWVVAAIVAAVVAVGAAVVVAGDGGRSDAERMSDELIAAWNDNDAAELRRLYAPDAEVIGLDGLAVELQGIDEILEQAAFMAGNGATTERIGGVLAAGDFQTGLIEMHSQGQVATGAGIVQLGDDGRIIRHVLIATWVPEETGSE